MPLSRRRRNPCRQVSFDALEGRLVMSTGVAHALHSQVQAEVVRAQARHVPGSFKGSIQLVGPSYVAFSDMTGKLGKLSLTGHGFGRVSGKQFLGATLQMSGSGGTLTIDLFQAPIKNAPGGAGTFNSQMVIRDATGNYAAAAGSGGKFQVTIKQVAQWYKKTKQLMTDSSDVNSLSDAAYFLLNSTRR